MGERSTVRPGSASSAAVLSPPADPPAYEGRDGDTLRAAEVEQVTYHVLLLAGEPQHHTCVLTAGLEAGAEIEVAGEQWTVADVRAGREGADVTLVCIYAV